MTNSNDPESRHTGDPRLAQIEKRLRRGTYLKGDERPLGRILDDDAAVVTRLELDLEEIGNRMQRFYEIGRKEMGLPTVVDDDFEVIVREDRGILACPFGDHFASPKAMVEVKNLKTGITLKYSVLAMHLIHRHGFFQGIGSPWRIDPEELADFFWT